MPGVPTALCAAAPAASAHDASLVYSDPTRDALEDLCEDRMETGEGGAGAVAADVHGTPPATVAPSCGRHGDVPPEWAHESARDILLAVPRLLTAPPVAVGHLLNAFKFILPGELPPVRRGPNVDAMTQEWIRDRLRPLLERLERRRDLSNGEWCLKCLGDELP